VRRAALLAVCACALGCPKRQGRGADLDPIALYEQIQRAHAGPETLSASGKAFVDAPQGGGRYALEVSVRRPRSLRIALLDPLGNPAALLVADGGRFALLDLRERVFYRGPSTPENLSRLLPAPLSDAELVALLLGAMPELPGATPAEAFRAGEGSVLVLRAGNVVQEVSVGDDLRLEHVRRSVGGRPWWSADLEEHDDMGGVPMPRFLRFVIPDRKTQVELRLKDRLVGKPPPNGAFQLGPPPGVKVVEVGER
jgi:hypothetical protein